MIKPVISELDDGSIIVRFKDAITMYEILDAMIENGDIELFELIRYAWNKAEKPRGYNTFW
jgi:hypothetical protein